ncbi:hypothetical protein [Amycolatopsis vastitatis]|uniref:Uncharacterized protein n=1 Tax=Amycolatopsis vastitatis TaxID=1905142 RepID=A0A229TEB7_9PSEU|nr:hypothetical protein [Amycolatopsis vastitatis]OXM69587.1 hypothetical protein CF165_08745 [Amycolatopsis vastitatis]
MSELLWVAVPSGLDGASALIRVLVVPRLQGSSLAEFGLQEWPSLLEGLTFELRTDTSAGIALAPDHPELRPAARLDVWQAFFGGQGGLINDWASRDYAPPAVDRTHDDAQRISHTYRDTVTRMARTPQDTPGIVDQALAPWQGGQPTPPPPPAPPIPTPVVPDFHRTVAMLREHPAVLRELGLVFELAVSRRNLEVGDPRRSRHLSIRCTDPVLDLLVRAPWTAYLLDDEHFLPASAPDAATAIRRGVVDLAGADVVSPQAEPDDSPPPWAVCTFEVDGAVGRLRDAANSTADERPAILPHLRSAGLQLVRPGRAADYAARADAARTNATADSMDDARLTAEDLVLGFRLDVKSGDGSWRSLTHRLATYTVNGTPIGSARAPEEGHVKPFAAVRGADAELRADEVVTRWSGWSHTVSPTNLLDDTPGPRREPAVPLPYDFGWRFDLSDVAPLPTLRFGTRYQLRVRVADATGGGLPVGAETDSTQCSEVVRYTRHEPVPPPRIAAEAGTFPPGAAVTTLVIRSDHDQSAEDLHHATPAYPAAERRSVHPPPVTFGVAEQHGVFDPPAGDEQTWAWAQRALRDDDPGGPQPDPATGGVNAVLRLDSTGEEHDGRKEWSPPWPDPRPKRIDLAESTDPDTPVALLWSGDGEVLLVRLGKGEAATVELSSTIHDRYSGHFSVLDWLAEAAVDVTDSLNGRHPQLTPPQVLRLVHAVRRPVAEPQWVLRPGAVNREPDDTTATIQVAFAGGGLHSPSTGRLDIGACWTEWTDAGDHPAAVDRVHSEPIAAGPPGRPPAFTFRHEFGDTKHRTLTYRLTAISRYRQCFDAAEPDSAFRVAKEQRAVSIPSSARPTPPTVLAVNPAFAWQTETTADQIVRMRRGRRVRVELSPPWYETGEGERLAVITAADYTDTVTQLGRDPLWGTPAPERFPAAEWFAGADEEKPLKNLPGPDRQVRVAAYTPVRAGDRWYADVELSRTGQVESYAPFVELVVARYQPQSLRDLELSTAVVTDKVPVLPDRSLLVRRAEGGVEVTLSGVMPSPANRVEAVIEVADGLTDLISVGGDDDGVPAWRTVTGPVFGEGNVPLPVLPVLPLPAAGAVRLRVREVELVDGVGDSPAPRELQERSVFIDTVPIPPIWGGG